MDSDIVQEGDDDVVQDIPEGPANAVTRRRDGLLSAVMLGRSGREQHVVAYIRISASVAIPEEGASQERALLRPDEQDLTCSPFFC